MRTVGEIVRGRETYVVSHQSTVREVVRVMDKQNVGAVCVLNQQRLVGIFTERDLLKKVVALSLDPDSTRVETVMTRKLIVVSPAEDWAKCRRHMQSARVRHLPVVADGKLLGLISLRELIEHESEEQSAALQMLVDYVQYVPPGDHGISSTRS